MKPNRERIIKGIAILAMVLSGATSFAEEGKEPVSVTVANYVRAESDGSSPPRERAAFG